MKKLKKILWVLLSILGMLAFIAGIFLYSLKPTYNGKKQLPNLSAEVKVYFDTYGIPHIYAQNEMDAFQALGYVHAQDRLWQMELLRRVASGGLSEVFGSKLIGTDKFFLSLGIDDASKKTVSMLNMSDPMVKISESYLKGVNQFIEEGPTPVEFYLTGIKKRPFTLTDVYNSVGYMAFSFAMAHKTDPLLTDIRNKLGPEYLFDLEIETNPNSLVIKNHRKVENKVVEDKLEKLIAEALKELPVPLFEGSNGWVISPSKTKNKKVILANDPHIGFAQPSVWYEAHLSTPTYEKYGYHLAGVPFPLLGHNRKLAYGLTMFENDDIDFYYEQTNPEDSTQYKTPDGWAAYEIVSKSIKVKDTSDITFSYKKTRRGPVLSGIADQLKDELPISMSWIYDKVDNKVMDAVYGMSHAQNLEGFQKALPLIHAPGLNIMYGDAEGNVAWWATAKLYQMPDSINTKFILDGTTGKEEPMRYLDFSENPQAINPPWNYVYSANNPPEGVNGKLYPGYYLPENRARRIVQLLEAKNNWDSEATAKMVTDVVSSVDPDIVTDLAKSIDVQKLTDRQLKELDKLNAWKGDYSLDSAEATIFHRWVYYFLKFTFEDELGEEQFEQFLATHFLKRLIAPMADKENSVWWDNINTKDVVETKKDIVNASFSQAILSLKADFGEGMDKWTWGKAHSLEHEHPIGQVKALRSFFNVGPFPVNGSREVINNMGFPYTDNGFYKVDSGPSTRRIIDFSDIENSMSILPTGQSGNPFSPHYKDQAEMFIKGEFRKMMMNKKEIEATSSNLLVFKPKE